MKREYVLVAVSMVIMLAYFLMAHPALNDDGFHYEGFAESAARGEIDFKSFYGFQGLSFLAVPVIWVTHSSISIIITSIILSLLSLPLAYVVGKEYYRNRRAGLFFMALVLLMPYPYTTMMRGFQEAALLFFVLLIIYGSSKKAVWTPLAWAAGGIVKPFALVLFPLAAPIFFKENLKIQRLLGLEIFKKIPRRNLIWMGGALLLGGIYLMTSYVQTGHLINNAAINSYQGSFDPGNPPPLAESFSLGGRGFARVAANLFISSRKILLSPLTLLLGILYWWKNKNLRWRKEAALAIMLNLILTGSLTFSFPKYLLPMVVLLALWAVPYLQKYWWLAAAVLIDSVFVFSPIYSYFGRNFWSSRLVFHLPLFLAGVIFLADFFANKKSGYQSQPETG